MLEALIHQHLEPSKGMFGRVRFEKCCQSHQNLGRVYNALRELPKFG